MGIAIQYCIFCQEQIPPRDVSEGRAVARPGGYVCVGCAKKAGLQAEESGPSKHMTPAPRRLSAASVPAARTSGHPTPAPPTKDPHASHVSHVSHVQHVPHAPPKRSPMPIILGGIGLVIVILLLVISVSRDAKDPKPTAPPKVEEPPDPRIARIQLALANARDVKPPKYDEAIVAFRDAAKILPGSSWAREATDEADAIEKARDAEAKTAFDRIKEEADRWEQDGQFTGALEEWKTWPKNLRGGDWGAKVDAEKKGIEDRRRAFEKEAQDFATDVLRRAATLADAKEFQKAIEALDTFPARFKSAAAASQVAQARTRYQDVMGTAVKQATGDLDSVEDKCIEALLAGDGTAARKLWQTLLGGAHDAKAKSEIEDLADFETDRERDGVAIWFSRNHIAVVPKSGKAWQGTTQGYIRIAGTADLEEDGNREIFIGLDGSKEDAGALVCMALDGTKRWQFDTGAIHWNQPGVTDKMSVMGLKIVDLNGDGKKEVISVSNHVKLFPCRVCVLTWEGKLESEYWHPGHGGSPLAADLDGDGKPEILMSFVNNDLNMTQVVACFSGTNIRGTAPPKGTDGTQLWYTQVAGAKAPMKRITPVRERKDGPVVKIHIEFQDGVWILGPDGSVIQKP